MTVDDITFCRFVNNLLPKDKMREAERDLINAGEADLSIQASIINYRINSVMAEEMLGIEYEEKLIPEEVRNDMSADSKDAKFNLSTTVMNNNFNKEEIQTIRNLVETVNNSINPEVPFEENLKQFYLLQRPGALPEEAEEVVSGIRKGIELFNSNLQQAMQEENFDYVSELENISSNMEIKDKYELYVNFLAALQSLSVNNISPEQMVQLEGFQDIRNRLLVKGEVSDEMLADIEKQISDMLRNNTFCMGSVESLKSLIAELPEGVEAIEREIAGSEKDVKEKMKASLAAYVAYRNGLLESYKNHEVTPEAVAISISAGMEEMKVMNELNAGKTTIDKAIKILKIIGGVALFSLLAYLAIVGIAMIGAMTTTLASFVFGASTFATIGALIAGILVIWPLTQSAVNTGEKILTWSSRLFDVVVETWRETAWPAIKNAVETAWKWMISLFRNGAISVQEPNKETQAASVI